MIRHTAIPPDGRHEVSEDTHPEFEPADVVTETIVKFKPIYVKCPIIQIRIRYKSSDGTTTMRPITMRYVMAVSIGNTLAVLKLVAFCHTEMRDRLFKISGILEAFDGENGYPLWDLTGWLFLAIGQARKRRFPKDQNLAPPPAMGGMPF